jgi:hypothetical protein
MAAMRCSAGNHCHQSIRWTDAIYQVRAMQSLALPCDHRVAVRSKHSLDGRDLSRPCADNQGNRQACAVHQCISLDGRDLSRPCDVNHCVHPMKSGKSLARAGYHCHPALTIIVSP